MIKDDVLNLFKSIQAEFPNLRMVLNPEPKDIDIEMFIPKQLGLSFELILYLDGDELHIASGALWFEWFPCNKPETINTYKDVVVGLLSGKYRIVEYYRGEKAVKAVLEKPKGQGWENIGTSSKLHIPYPWHMKTKVLINK